MSYTKEHVKTGLFWKSAQMITEFGFNLIIKLILAYLLMPEAFGLIGMALVFVALISEYTDLGLGAALIQRKESELKPIHWNSIFWCNIFMNWVGFLIIVIGISRLAAIYYGEEILYYIVIGISVKLIWSPFSFIQRIKLNKEMKFKTLFIIQVVTAFTGGVVGVLMAYQGFGVWSLVGQTLSGSLVALLITWLLVKWTPKFLFSIAAVKDLLSFGIYDLFIRLVGFSHLHMNILILGFLFNPIVVGYYTFASSFTIKLFKPINNLFKKVFYPFFSSIADEKHRIKKYYLSQIKYVTLLLHPLNTGIVILSQYFIVGIWGEKWQGAVYPLQLLAIFCSILASGGEGGTILKSIGNIQSLFKLQLIRFVVIKIPLVIVGGLFWRLEGFLIGLLVSQLIIFFVNYLFIKNIFDLKLFEIIKMNLGGLVGSTVMGLSIYFFIKMASQIFLAHLIFISIVGGIIYLISYYSLSKLFNQPDWLVQIQFQERKILVK